MFLFVARVLCLVILLLDTPLDRIVAVFASQEH